MTPQEHIAKLEALLKRVQTRSAEPRRPRAVERVEARPQRVEKAEPVAPVVAAAPLRAAPLVAPVERKAPEVPAIKPPPMPLREAPKEPIADVDLDALPAPSPAIEVQKPVAAAVKSDERIKAAEPLAAAEDVSPDELVAAAEDKEAVTEIDAIATSDDVLDVDVSEPAPLSSRRPVAIERDAGQKNLAELAFGEEQPAPPRHTPPPESGKLPAAPTVEFDGDVTGVREAAKLGPAVEAKEREAPKHQAERDEVPSVRTEITEPLPLPPPRAASPAAVTRTLTPEIARPVIEPSAPAVDYLGEAQAFRPKTFVELLEASLSL